MNSYGFSKIFRVAALTACLPALNLAQPQSAHVGVVPVDAAVNARATVDAGRIGQPFLKPPQQFDPSMIVRARDDHNPGLSGSFARATTPPSRADRVRWCMAPPGNLRLLPIPRCSR